MNTELARNLIENWNGKDQRFLFEGEIYSEDDVNEAYEYLEEIKEDFYDDNHPHWNGKI